MWQPVSSNEYVSLEPTAQAVVVACSLQFAADEIRRLWRRKACAWLGDSSMYLPGLVRDLLANPHVRIVVFHGTACGRAAYDEFWYGQRDPGWGILPDHLTLVRQFVDLYDDDFSIKAPMPPFWPERIRYEEKEQT